MEVFESKLDWSQFPESFTHDSCNPEQRKLLEENGLMVKADTLAPCKRDENGWIIIEDPRDAQIKALTDHLTQLTNQLNVLTQVVSLVQTKS